MDHVFFKQLTSTPGKQPERTLSRYFRTLRTGTVSCTKRTKFTTTACLNQQIPAQNACIDTFTVTECIYINALTTRAQNVYTETLTIPENICINVQTIPAQMSVLAW